VSVAPIRKPKADEQIELLRAILGVLTDIRTELRRAPQPVDVPASACDALVRALAEHFGPARFIVKQCLEAAEDNPHGKLADALAQLIDMNASPHARATQLGALLSRMRGIEIISTRPHIYQVACHEPADPEAQQAQA
jgi:hypothetical protein